MARVTSANGLCRGERDDFAGSGRLTTHLPRYGDTRGSHGGSDAMPFDRVVACAIACQGLILTITTCVHTRILQTSDAREVADNTSRQRQWPIMWKGD